MQQQLPQYPIDNVPVSVSILMLLLQSSYKCYLSRIFECMKRERENGVSVSINANATEAAAEGKMHV